MLIESLKSGILDIELMDGLQGCINFLDMVCKKNCMYAYLCMCGGVSLLMHV